MRPDTVSDYWMLVFSDGRKPVTVEHRPPQHYGFFDDNGNIVALYAARDFDTTRCMAFYYPIKETT